MKRTALKRKGGLERRARIKQRKSRRRAEDEPKRQAFRQAAAAQRVCAVSGSPGWPWEAHHVVERQELRRRGVDEWDPRNALRLTQRAHEQHTLAVKRVPLRRLTDENIEFAVELMGLAAHVYLTRMYDGHDERLELAIAELGAPDAAG